MSAEPETWAFLMGYCLGTAIAPDRLPTWLRWMATIAMAVCYVLAAPGCAAVCATRWDTTVAVERDVYPGVPTPSGSVSVGGELGASNCGE